MTAHYGCCISIEASTSCLVSGVVGGVRYVLFGKYVRYIIEGMAGHAL